MPKANEGAPAAPAEAQSGQANAGNGQPQSGFPITASQDVEAALDRSLIAALKANRAPAQAPTPEAEPETDEGNEPPPESATATPQQNPDLEAEDSGASPDPEAEATEAEAEEPKPSRNTQKRIDELTREKRTMEAELAELRNQVATLSQAKPAEAPTATTQPPTATPGPNHVAHVSSVDDLRALATEQQNLLDWAEDGLADVEVDPESVAARLKPHAERLGLTGQPTDWSEGLLRSTLLRVRKAANKMLTRDIPQQHQFLQARQQADAAAARSFEWWNNRASAEHKQIETIMAQNPVLNQLPGARMALAFMMEGQKAMAERAKANGQSPAANGSKPPLPPKTPKRPAQVPSRQPANAEQAAREALTRNPGDGEALENLLTLQLRKGRKAPAE